MSAASLCVFVLVVGIEYFLWFGASAGCLTGSGDLLGVGSLYSLRLVATVFSKVLQPNRWNSLDFHRKKFDLVVAPSNLFVGPSDMRNLNIVSCA